MSILILSVSSYSNKEDIPVFCILELTEEFAKKALKRIELFSKIQDAEDDWDLTKFVYEEQVTYYCKYSSDLECYIKKNIYHHPITHLANLNISAISTNDKYISLSNGIVCDFYDTRYNSDGHGVAMCIHRDSINFYTYTDNHIKCWTAHISTDNLLEYFPYLKQ